MSAILLGWGIAILVAGAVFYALVRVHPRDDDGHP